MTPCFCIPQYSKLENQKEKQKMKREKDVIKLPNWNGVKPGVRPAKNTTTRRLLFMGVGRNFLHRQVKGRYNGGGGLHRKQQS